LLQFETENGPFAVIIQLFEYAAHFLPAQSLTVCGVKSNLRMVKRRFNTLITYHSSKSIKISSKTKRQ